MTKDVTGSAGANGLPIAAQVAADVVATVREEKFPVLPHLEVAVRTRGVGKLLQEVGASSAVRRRWHLRQSVHLERALAKQALTLTS
jgi:hypothetical protein